MEQPPEAIAVLGELLQAVSDEDRMAIEQANLAKYDSGLHDGDPEEQPELPL